LFYEHFSLSSTGPNDTTRCITVCVGLRFRINFFHKNEQQARKFEEEEQKGKEGTKEGRHKETGKEITKQARTESKKERISTHLCLGVMLL
jgi:hypothetical protein